MKIIDQTGRAIIITEIPSRIVCCVPSITEYLIEIDAVASMVGRTKFCIYPEKKVAAIEKVGGTKNLNIGKIKKLQPDLVIANKEENNKEDIDQLIALCPTYISDIKTLEDAFQMMQTLALVLGKSESFEKLERQFNNKLKELKKHPAKRKCLYLIWKKPYMTIGGDTFIHSMLTIAGFENKYVDQMRYPVIEDIDKALEGVSHLLLSTEPYPFSDKHVIECQKKYPNLAIVLVDGAAFSWYGSRMVKALDYFDNLL